MYRQALPVGQLGGRDAYLRGMCPVGALGVYIGPLTRLMQGVGPAVPCHQGRPGPDGHHPDQLRRGAAYVQSAWVLLARPTEELFAERVGATYRSPRELGRRIQHSLDLAAFLERPPKELTALTRAAGVRSEQELLPFLAALPTRRQRELGVPCLADEVVGAEHTCRWAPQDAEQVHATPARA